MSRYRGDSLYVLYLMLVQDTGGSTLVKIGITSKIDARYFSVQTGCPFPIAEARHVLCGDEIAAQTLERVLHGDMQEHHTIGEWFNVTSSEAKAALNAALKLRVPQAIGPHKWTVLTPAQLRELRLEALAVHADECARISEARRDRARKRNNPVAVAMRLRAGKFF